MSDLRAFVAVIAALLLLVAGVALGAYTWDRHDRAESCVRLGERTGYTTRFTDDSFGVCLIQSSSGGMVPMVGRFTDE